MGVVNSITRLVLRRLVIITVCIYTYKMSHDAGSSDTDVIFMLNLIEKGVDFNCKFNLKISEMNHFWNFITVGT